MCLMTCLWHSWTGARELHWPKTSKDCSICERKQNKNLNLAWTSYPPNLQLIFQLVCLAIKSNETCQRNKQFVCTHVLPPGLLPNSQWWERFLFYSFDCKGIFLLDRSACNRARIRCLLGFRGLEKVIGIWSVPQLLKSKNRGITAASFHI